MYIYIEGASSRDIKAKRTKCRGTEERFRDTPKN